MEIKTIAQRQFTARRDRVIARMRLVLQIFEIVSAERPSAGGRRSESTVGTISVAELERARAKMIEYANELSSATLAAYPATADPEACRYCAYSAGCRQRPPAAQERFGR